MKYNITHLSSAHYRYDTRIFIKECTSLAKVENYHVSLVVADGLGDEIKNNVHFFDAGARSTNRYLRMTKTTKSVYKKALELDSDCYHIHDPELLFVGRKLVKKGKKVIYDSHEDLPKQIMSKPYIPSFLRSTVAKFFKFLEHFILKNYSAIVTATPIIRDKFLKINKLSMDINNFPVLSEFVERPKWSSRKDEVCYIGAITIAKGILPTIKALKYNKVKLQLAGSCLNENLYKHILEMEEYQYVNEHGFVDREGIQNILNQVKVGMVTFLAVPNYIESQPIKMFEYMAAGIPVISSNFPYWKSIIEASNCGICVDPENVEEIAKAIDYLLKNNDVAESMGKNGQEAVKVTYNWEKEAVKLVDLYRKILN